MKIAIISDIHGRNNWKDIVKSCFDKVDKIVFIGDYVDSFDISSKDINENFVEIIKFSKNNKDRVILILGNHDYYYYYFYSRKQKGFRQDDLIILNTLFESNLELFKLFYKQDNYIFSHGGITNSWIKNFIEKDVRKVLFDSDNNIDIFVNNHDSVFKTNNSLVYFNMCSEFRGGPNIDSGPFWTDKKELELDPLENYNQVVGHTYVDNVIIKKVKNIKLFFTDCLSNKNEYLIVDTIKDIYEIVNF